jgi:hypothetical protein
MSGVVYFLYLAAIELAMTSAGRLPAAYNGALLMVNVFYLILAVLFYGLFRPVNTGLSLLAAVCGVAGCVVGVLHYFHLATGLMSIPFLAVFILLIGFLIVRSMFLPRILGWLMVLNGVGWLVYMLPSKPNALARDMAGFSFAVEALLMLWLLVKGVNITRWRQQQAGKARAV